MLGCVLMASGLGRRFGGDKLMADFDGSPLISRALAATEDLFDKRVLLTRSAAAAEFARARGVAVTLHTLPRRSDAMRLGLEQMAEMDGCLFCPCDQPLLTRQTVAALAAAFARQPGPSGGFRRRDSPVRRWCFPAGPLPSWPRCSRAAAARWRRPTQTKCACWRWTHGSCSMWTPPPTWRRRWRITGRVPPRRGAPAPTPPDKCNGGCGFPPRRTPRPQRRTNAPR